jgi:hypothetical protein
MVVICTPSGSVLTVWITASPLSDSGFRQASHTDARSAYLVLKWGFVASFTAPVIAPCAFASAPASSLI